MAKLQILLPSNMAVRVRSGIPHRGYGFKLPGMYPSPARTIGVIWTYSTERE